ncbi:hypothetical protein [Magnetofaba australis]|uniref:Putative bacteriophage-like protein n=1 Tax=Magnetofaba australis IT-1 TaxID=1434232 RepID=A0A1Y2K4J8_9PROT|nr:hypothetical protein [Magnetofaba australis]OSM04159.1 putative bacteriophage-like protein [Magnetofaba australis IT-1]OSM04473.1 putative bacteriophage-like protein [Magnetofaba australis IT-1]
MKVPSNRRLAKHLGVSETAVRKAEKAGRIHREPDGSWDLDTVLANWSANTDDVNQRSAHPKGMKPTPTAAVNSVRETLQQSGQSAGAGGMTFMQAKTADMVLRAQLRKIELEEKKGSLIDREQTLARVYHRAREVRDSWQNWPARVSSRMAAELGVDDHTMHICLEQYVREHLEELSEAKLSLE